MAVPFSNNKLRVPHGFQALLEGMAKEILFNQPPDIYAFSALYFENLLKIREGGTPDPVTKYAQIEDRTSNNRAFQVSDNSGGLEDEENAAVTIQTKYRQHQAKTTADEMRQYNAAVKIQAGVRGHITRKKMETIRNADDEERHPGDERSLPDEDEENEDVELSGSQHHELPADVPAAAASPEPLVEESHEEPNANTAEDVVTESNEETEVAAEMQAQLEEAETADAEVTEDTVSLDKTETLEDGNAAKDLENRPASGVKDEQEDAVEPEADDEMRLGVVDNDAEEAASKIQAGFRGMKTRREVAELAKTKAADVPVVIEDDKTEEPHENADPDVEQHDDSNTDQSVDLEHLAATKIQAGFRGMKTRQELVVLKQARAEAEEDDARPEDLNTNVAVADESEAKVADDASDEQKQAEGEEDQLAVADKEPTDETEPEPQLTATAPPDEVDPDTINRAAGKIQAGFRGMTTRKQIKELKERLATNEGDVDETAAVAEAIDASAEAEADADLQADAAAAAAVDEMTARTDSVVENVDDVPTDADATVDEKEAEVDEDSGDQQALLQEAAALKIQAAIAGYNTRNSMDMLNSTTSLDAEVAIDDAELDAAVDEAANAETSRDSVDPEIARLTRESVEPETAREGSADETEIARESHDLDFQEKPADETAVDSVEVSETVPVDDDNVSKNEEGSGGEEEEEELE